MMLVAMKEVEVELIMSKGGKGILLLQDTYRGVRSAAGSGTGAKIPLLISKVNQTWSRYMSPCLNAYPKNPW